MNGVLNVAAFCSATRVLGPGKRFALWVQGCPFDCPGCVSPEWREMKVATPFTPKGMAQKALAVPDLEGLTLSGGEPMVQAQALLEMVRRVRAEKPVSVICYTGFELEALVEKQSPAIDGLLAQIDVLIDGPYTARLNNNKGWRGSSNQRVHFLSGRYQDREMDFLDGNRDIEIHLFDDHYLMVGVHPVGVDDLFLSFFRESWKITTGKSIRKGKLKENYREEYKKGKAGRELQGRV